MTFSQKKKRIVLVHPRGFNWFPGKRDITDIANRMVPQGLLSIAAYLIKQGHDVVVYDCLGPGAPVDLQKQAQEILSFQPQIVGFSATTSSFPMPPISRNGLRNRIRTSQPSAEAFMFPRWKVSSCAITPCLIF